MSEFEHPGVYTQEVSKGAGPIEGVSTSILGLVGWMPKGEINKPIICTDFKQFVDKFGNFNADTLSAHMAYAYFANGGGRLYFVRVASEDAEDASWDLARMLDGSDTEEVTDEAQATGIYNFNLGYAPIVPGTVTLTFENTTPGDQNVFIDDGEGVLAHDVANGSGGVAAIDYETGEISVTLAAPGEYTGTTEKVTASYAYKVFKFKMKWPGVVGNHYRIRITQGSDDYLIQEEARWTRFNVFIDEDLNQDPSNRRWRTVDTNADLIFDNPADPNYLVTVINADITGSEFIEVVDYGNGMAPLALQGTKQENEDFSGSMEHSDGSAGSTYDGTWKGWKYAVGNGVFPNTFVASFQLKEDGLQIGTAASPAANTASVVSPGSSSIPAAIVPGTVSISATVGGAPATIVDDGTTGALSDGSDGYGTIDYATGAISGGQLVNDGVALFDANTIITLSCTYAEPVKIEDDANGNLALSENQETGYPQKFTLNSSGSNSINYEDGTFELTWKITGQPAAGPADAQSQTATYYTEPDSTISGIMVDGSDGSAISSSDIISPALVAERKGLFSLDKTNEMMQVVVSDFQTDILTIDALITWSELRKDKFGIFTVPHGLTPQQAINWKKFKLGKFTSYGALYYPHIKINDPVSNSNMDIPCGGHVAGVYARTDSVKSVSSAPAGMGKGNLNWSVGLEIDLEESEVGLLNPNRINCLVSWEYTGRVVWGARTMDVTGGDWMYIQARRLFMFVQKSVYRSTHVHVFEDNNSLLWTSIRNQVTGFLGRLQDNGYFPGETAADSFFVICDRSNNPETSVKKGITFCDVGIATTTPGEFIVFRFQPKAL